MISYTNADLAQNTAHLQQLANELPILIADGDTKQVLMSYERYKELAGENADKPFISAYDAFMEMMSGYTDEELDALARDDIELDMSFAENR